MQAISSLDVASSVCVSLSLCVCVLVTRACPAKTAEPIHTSFGVRLEWAQGTMY